MIANKLLLLGISFSGFRGVECSNGVFYVVA